MESYANVNIMKMNTRLRFKKQLFKEYTLWKQDCFDQRSTRNAVPAQKVAEHTEPGKDNHLADVFSTAVSRAGCE